MRVKACGLLMGAREVGRALARVFVCPLMPLPPTHATRNQHQATDATTSPTVHCVDTRGHTAVRVPEGQVPAEPCELTRRRLGIAPSSRPLLLSHNNASQLTCLSPPPPPYAQTSPSRCSSAMS